MSTVVLAYSRMPQNKHQLSGYYSDDRTTYSFNGLSYREMITQFAGFVQRVGLEGNTFMFKRTDRPEMQAVDIGGLAADLVNNPEETIERLDNPPVFTFDTRKKESVK